MNSDIEPLLSNFTARVAGEPAFAAIDLLALVRPSIRLATERVPYALLELGESRIGGVPDVPPDFEWPRWKLGKQRDDKFGEPWIPEGAAAMGFIAQIDMSAMPRVSELLPMSGWLYFFYDRHCESWGFDPADRGSCRILYADCDRSRLLRMQPPADADPDHLAAVCRVEAWPELTLREDPPGVEYDTPAYDAYWAIRNDLINDHNGGTIHRLLGHAQIVQNPMELECQLASNGVFCGSASRFQEAEARALEPGAVDWRLLLQIDTDEEGPGWMWGDVGRIYFWIKEQDLKVLRFDDAWLVLQCC